jgi:hypothetical protein
MRHISSLPYIVVGFTLSGVACSANTSFSLTGNGFRSSAQPASTAPSASPASSSAPAATPVQASGDPSILHPDGNTNLALHNLRDYEVAKAKAPLLSSKGANIHPVELLTGWEAAWNCSSEPSFRPEGNKVKVPLVTKAGETLAPGEMMKRCDAMLQQFKAHKVTTCGFRLFDLIEVSLGGGAWSEPELKPVIGDAYTTNEDTPLDYRPCNEMPEKEKMLEDDPRTRAPARDYCGKDAVHIVLERWNTVLKRDLPTQRVSKGHCWYRNTTRRLNMPTESELQKMKAAAESDTASK